jgi:hypothetical protein
VTGDTVVTGGHNNEWCQSGERDSGDCGSSDRGSGIIVAIATVGIIQRFADS